MSSAIERTFIETRSHNDRPMNGFLSDRHEFSSGIAPKSPIVASDHRHQFAKIKDFAQEFNLKSTIKLQSFDRYAHNQKSEFLMDNKQSHHYNTEHSPTISSHIF
ncbi:hypothetical protein AVEN_120087-1 [Araneus ventricosus]|uniref:Uncharacterized protein n=1 Tax=Araneus ventricosus TaxID=182803 RepID=A0A4Y2G4B7_ARAVE|nr:hypothetical protein AVEN_120087-1 [Araneus ventricosus]